MRTRRRRRPCGTKSGFTLVELLLMVVVLGVAAGISLTLLETTGSKTEAAARVLMADLAYAQAEAVARPDVGCLIRLLPNGKRYWLARPAASNTALVNPITKRDYQVDFGEDAYASLDGVAISAYQLGGDNMLQFNAYGGLDQVNDAVFIIGVGSNTVGVAVQAITGVSWIEKDSTALAKLLTP